MVEVVVTAAVAVAGAAIGAWATLRARRPPRGTVELVDVTVIDETRHAATDTRLDQESPEIASLAAEPVGGFAAEHRPTVDIKLRNPGGQAVFVKRIELVVSESAILPITRYPGPEATPITASAVPGSTFHGELPVPKSSDPFQVTYDVSQVVPPGDVDRFRLRLSAASEGRATLYRIRVRLLYNRDGRSLVSPPLLLALPSAPEIPSPEAMQAHLMTFQRDAEGDIASDRRRLSTLPLDERTDMKADLDDPQQAIARCLDEEERTLRKLVQMAADPGLCDPCLTDAVRRAQRTLSELPRIREELLGPG